MTNKQSCGAIQLKKEDKDYENLKSNVQGPRHRNFKLDGLQIQALRQQLRKMPMQRYKLSLRIHPRAGRRRAEQTKGKKKIISKMACQVIFGLIQ